MKKQLLTLTLIGSMLLGNLNTNAVGITGQLADTWLAKTPFFNNWFFHDYLHFAIMDSSPQRLSTVFNGSLTLLASAGLVAGYKYFNNNFSDSLQTEEDNKLSLLKRKPILETALLAAGCITGVIGLVVSYERDCRRYQ